MTRTRPLDASLRSTAGYNLKRVYLLIREAVLEVLAPYGLKPPSFSALVVVCDNPDLTQSRLAEALHIKRSGMVVIVDELEQAGLISRNPVPGDRRSYALRATLKGMRMRDRATAAVIEAESGVLANLNATEQRLLGGLYAKLLDGRRSGRPDQEQGT